MPSDHLIDVVTEYKVIDKAKQASCPACGGSDHRINSFKINALIFDILPYEFVSH
jgi:hypothetical protein